MLDQFKAARRAAVPLIGIETPEPAGTIETICKSLNGKFKELPVFRWDCAKGLVALNDMSKPFASDINENQDPKFSTAEPFACASRLSKCPDKSIVFWLNGHKFIDNAMIMQAVWNLRDDFKSRHCTFIVLAPFFSVPPELKHDVLILSEPLPTSEQLQTLTKQICNDAASTIDSKKYPTPEGKDMVKCVDSLTGLSFFAAEQALAMSITKTGIDMHALWQRKVQAIEQTPGLTVWKGGERFEDVGGCENIKSFLSAVINGKKAPRAIVFIDEIEKALSGSTGDTSGVSQSMLGTLLSYMQDTDATGCIFIGPPGSAKSMIAKATGNTAEIPTIAFDLSGMKNSLVGESEARLRQSLKVVDAVAQGQTLFIATCNSIGVLPPELRRRFTFGTFFFDLPTAKERLQIWQLYCTKFELDPHRSFSDNGWTGAEIRQCCNIAWRLNISLNDASRFIVPVASSAKDQIEALRLQASGKFISASYPGVFYSHQENENQTSSRKIAIE